jgi:hypothetical protein
VAEANTVVDALSLIVVALFGLYALLDALALLPRVAGSHLGMNGLGYTFSVMVQTVKRVFVVSYPPLLGWISISGGELYSTIYWSYFVGVVALLIVFTFRFALIRYFMVLIDAYSMSGSLWGTACSNKPKNIQIEESMGANFNFKIDKKLVLSSSWVFFVYGSALFFINLFGAKFQEHSAVIYQLVGIINALGTLLMSFYLDPKISRNFDHRADVMQSNDSVMMGQLIALALLGPISIMVFGMVA